MHNISDRKKEILEAIVKSFVQTAEPVGSCTITRYYLKDFSPATIRNEMKELEDIGYITHPHTSAGRIPTDIGYRYYVDNIMETKNIAGKDIALIKTGIKKVGRGFEEIARGTIRMISNALNCASIFASFGRKKILQFAGLSNMLKQPEFQKIDTARHIVETVEQEEIMSEVLREYAKNNSLTIKIGNENLHKNLKDMSVVVANYNLKETGPGAIGIIGPTRMDYKRVVSVLNLVSRELENMGF